MPIYKQHLAYTEINNDQAFTVTVPTLFSMQRGDRQEVLSMFKEFGGKWNASGQFWVFNNHLALALADLSLVEQLLAFTSLL